MKRLGLRLIFAAIASVLTFSSCNSDNDEPDDIAKPLLVGSWDATQLLIDGNWRNIAVDDDTNFSVTFYDDNRYHGNGYIAEGWGTYFISGNEIKVLYDNTVLLTLKVQSLNGDKMQATLTKGGTVVTASLSKGGNAIITPQQ